MVDESTPDASRLRVHGATHHSRMRGSVTQWDAKDAVPFPSEDVTEKAMMLLEGQRVLPYTPERVEHDAGLGISSVLVRGETGDYHVHASEQGFMCDCYAGSDHSWNPPRCSHVLAAMLWWSEAAPSVVAPEVLEATSGRPEVTGDPKPSRRIVDSEAGREKLANDPWCRGCGCHAAQRPLTRHHLIKKSQGGDDVPENIVPLCGSGTTGCHGEVEHFQGTTRSRVRRSLRPEEILYVVTTKSAAWLDKYYPQEGTNDA